MTAGYTPSEPEHKRILTKTEVLKLFEQNNPTLDKGIELINTYFKNLDHLRSYKSITGSEPGKSFWTISLQDLGSLTKADLDSLVSRLSDSGWTAKAVPNERDDRFWSMRVYVPTELN